jgi:hypothetical protein
MIFLSFTFINCMKYFENTAHAIDLDSNTCRIIPVTSVNASGNQPGYPASYAVDNNSKTRWANDGKGSWIQLNLASVQNVCAIESSWYKGNTRAYYFVLSSSTDGTTFKNNIIGNNSKNTKLGSDRYDINNTKGRYIRITVNGNSEGNNFASMSNIKVYGTPVSTPVRPNITSDNNESKSVSTDAETKHGSSINILADGNSYFPGDPIIIGGSVHSGAGAPLYNNSVFIVVSNSSHPSKVLDNISVITDLHGNYGYRGLRIVDSDLSTLPSNVMEWIYPPLKIIEKPYIINATTSYNGTKSHAWVTVEIKNGFFTSSAKMLVIGAVLFLLFLIIVAWPMKMENKQSKWEYLKFGQHLKEILIFAIISSIALNPIVSLVLLDMEVGKTSPIGLVKKDSNINGTTHSQWVMNVGGSSDNAFMSGIQIPTYIVVFGVAGGYIRYLYDKYQGRRGLISAPVIISPGENDKLETNQPQIRGTGDSSTILVLYEETNPIFTTSISQEGKWNVNSLKFPAGEHSIRARTFDDSDNISDYSNVCKFNIPEDAKSISQENIPYVVNPSQYNIVDSRNSKFFKESIQDIALIFLSPLLAIAIWFVLFQGGTTADYTLAAIGITTGFLIKEIVTRMINFASPKVSSTPSDNS